MLKYLVYFLFSLLLQILFSQW